MPCGGGCGGSKATPRGARGFDPTREPTPKRNDRNMYLLEGDSYMCEPYHGALAGAPVFAAGLGTEHAKLFVYAQRFIGLAYAVEHRVSFHRITAGMLCHDRVVELFGA